jgi:hypothetical protein
MEQKCKQNVYNIWFLVIIIFQYLRFGFVLSFNSFIGLSYVFILFIFLYKPVIKILFGFAC